MSSSIQLFIIFSLASMVFAQYQTRFETVDVDSILNNRRLMDAYTKCYLDKGPCAPPAREAKKYFAEIFRTNCGKCSREQKKQIKTAFSKLITVRPQDFQKIFAKYNPGNTHWNSFMRWLRSSD
ncbi:ejaculatory bulb-specific protein 3 [Halyomorpha halys]|uniref:ejaculatory bulb-specific protein 3 n=1 Tax=Halyomorpha halys TaxID=286706 RepID=UPI000D0C87C7|nr:ejaculatory bulb-specific protein 3-like [Halyomorpha halys]